MTSVVYADDKSNVSLYKKLMHKIRSIITKNKESSEQKSKKIVRPLSFRKLII